MSCLTFSVDVKLTLSYWCSLGAFAFFCVSDYQQRNYWQKLFFSGHLLKQSKKTQKTHKHGNYLQQQQQRQWQRIWNNFWLLDCWRIYDKSTHLEIESAPCFTWTRALSTYTLQVKTVPHSLIHFFYSCYAFIAENSVPTT